MAEEKGSPMSDGEAFHSQLRDMMNSSTNKNGMSTVDLEESSPQSFGSLSLDDSEGPFKAPTPSSFPNENPRSPVSHSASTAGLTPSGAYPRPLPVPHTSNKVEQVKAQVKEFTVETFRTTKQLINEMLGKGTRTVDPQLDTAIHDLRSLQTTYAKLLEQTSNLHSYLSNVIYTQKQMTNVFSELSQRDPGLAEDFNCNAEVQKVLIKNGEHLLGALTFFMSNMRTLCHKTIQDCLDTVKKYQSARLQYDTYRSEHEQTVHSAAASSLKTAEIRQKYEEKKRYYEQLKADVSVKMQFLHENKNKVVHRQMILFHNAIAAYFGGNQQQLSGVLGQFSIKLTSPNSDPPSWLEK